MEHEFATFNTMTMKFLNSQFFFMTFVLLVCTLLAFNMATRTL